MSAIHQGKRAKARELLEEIADAFRQDFPEVYTAQLEFINETKKALLSPTGISTGGGFMASLSVHPLIFQFVEKAFTERLDTPRFFSSPENIDLLRAVWSDFQLTRERKEVFHGIDTADAASN
jgi:hypothetical protein